MFCFSFLSLFVSNFSLFVETVCTDPNARADSMYFIFKFLLYLVLRCEIVRSKWTSLCFIFWTFRLICRGSDWVVCMSPVIRLAWSNTLESNNNTLLSNILQQPADNSLNSKRNICFQERCNLDFHLNYWEESFFDKTKCNNCSLGCSRRRWSSSGNKEHFVKFESCTERLRSGDSSAWTHP